MAENLDRDLSTRPNEMAQQVGTATYRVTMNGTTAVAITLRQGTYRVRLFNADPTVFAIGSFGTANPALPASGSGQDDLQVFPSGAIPETLFVGSDNTFNVKLSAAGTPEMLFSLIV